MKYTEPKMELSVFDAENIITASNEGGNNSMSPAMTQASAAAKEKAGTNGVAIDLLF